MPEIVPSCCFFFLCVLDNNPALCLVSGAGYLAQSPHWDPLKHSKSFERPPPGMARSHIGSGTTVPCRRWIHTMGLLKVGTPLHWDDMLEHCSYIRRHGTLEAWLMAWGPGVRTWQMVKDRPHWDTKWHARLLTLDPPTQTWQWHRWQIIVGYLWISLDDSSHFGTSKWSAPIISYSTFSWSLTIIKKHPGFQPNAWTCFTTAIWEFNMENHPF